MFVPSTYQKNKRIAIGGEVNDMTIINWKRYAIYEKVAKS